MMYHERGLSLCAFGALLLPLTLLSGCTSEQSAVSSSAAAGSPIRQPVIAPQPRGSLPVGWVGYRSATAPFALAHPADWTVDESAAPVGETSFVEPGKEPITMTITSRPVPRQRPNDDVLRARFISYSTRGCESGRTVLSQGKVTEAGLSFATATVRCAGEAEEPGGAHGATYFLGVSVKDRVQWTFAFRTSNEDFAQDRTAVIDRALQSFNV